MAKPPSQLGDDKTPLPVCGIIMPIAAMPPKYEASHWSDVRKVLDAAISKASMTAQIVSDSFESDVIQQRIIHNLYDNPVVICDVSGLNPNVMFELGMRITFKQPVIIITDDIGSIPFDTKVIEHLPYPPDLHIHKTNDFINRLTEKIIRLRDQKADGSFRSFIEAFGTFEVLEPTTKPVAADTLILDRLNELTHSISRIDHNQRSSSARSSRNYRLHPTRNDTTVDIFVSPPEPSMMDIAYENLKSRQFVSEVVYDILNEAQGILTVEFISRAARDKHVSEVANALMSFFASVSVSP